MQDPRFVKIATCTTRMPRAGEVPGKDYHFLPEEEFERKIGEGFFFEHAKVHGEHYGTPRQAILDELGRGRVVVLDIDVQGAQAVRRSGLPAVLVFLLPPDEPELLRRIRGRKTEAPEQVRRRRETADGEMRQKDAFDRVVVNDDVDRAAGEIVE